ncbi:hypothetical protein Hypma_011514 [Hypsizygus marmoreus]|uniref:Pali-domain-containing protein n=1 Tax=Hypsizygus marmoreus TaxID=39966 RepID=A0A369JGI2_HYPMA|nr:hypothetical protein Hypma_011514 [Hypsizygus marmoreus]
MLAALTPVLIFVAFLLLLLVSLSAPIIKSIFLFRLTANIGSSLLNTGASGSVAFGVWGYCISAIDISIVGIDHSTTARCSSTRLGYTFDQTVADALHADDLQNLISRTTTGALVLHPIVAALIFIAFLASLFALRRGTFTSRIPAILAFALVAIPTTVVFLIDLIFVALVRHKVRDVSNGGVDLVWGNAVWMTLGATVALWLAMVSSCAGVCFGRRFVFDILSLPSQLKNQKDSQTGKILDRTSHIDGFCLDADCFSYL